LVKLIVLAFSHLKVQQAVFLNLNFVYWMTYLCAKAELMDQFENYFVNCVKIVKYYN